LKGELANQASQLGWTEMLLQFQNKNILLTAIR